MTYGEHGTPDGKSTLTDYVANTHFCPAMCNLDDDAAKRTHPFAYYSEATAGMGATLPPYIAQGLEDAGYFCAYAPIAKGGVVIRHYLDGDAAAYFDEKVRDFSRTVQRNSSGMTCGSGCFSGRRRISAGNARRRR